MDDDRATKSKERSTTSVDGTCDDYDILKAIGKGKFSTVYRARRKSDGSPVALKKIHGFAELQDERKKEKERSRERERLTVKDQARDRTWTVNTHGTDRYTETNRERQRQRQT